MGILEEEKAEKTHRAARKVAVMPIKAPKLHRGARKVEVMPPHRGLPGRYNTITDAVFLAGSGIRPEQLDVHRYMAQQDGPTTEEEVQTAKRVMKYALRERLSVEEDLQQMKKENQGLMTMANMQKDHAEDLEHEAEMLRKIVQSMQLKAGKDEQTIAYLKMRNGHLKSEMESNRIYTDNEYKEQRQYGKKLVECIEKCKVQYRNLFEKYEEVRHSNNAWEIAMADHRCNQGGRSPTATDIGDANFEDAMYMEDYNEPVFFRPSTFTHEQVPLDAGIVSIEEQDNASYRARVEGEQERDHLIQTMTDANLRLLFSPEELQQMQARNMVPNLAPANEVPASDVARRRANVVNRSRVEAPANLTSLSAMYEEEKKEEEPLPRPQPQPQGRVMRTTESVIARRLIQEASVGSLLVTFVPGQLDVTGDLGKLNAYQKRCVVIWAPNGATTAIVKFSTTGRVTVRYSENGPQRDLRTAY